MIRRDWQRQPRYGDKVPLPLSESEITALTERMAEMMPRVRADLEELVRIPSVNFPGYDTAPVIRCAEAVAVMLREAGATGVQLRPSSSGVPTILAEVPGPPGAPTVLLYSHYDVQPGGEESRWQSPPFEPTLRDGRLFGRGAADDKSGVVTHIACVRALAADPPVTLRILLEGEEEYGGDFEEWPTTRPEAFAGADVALIIDSGGVDVGIPTFTTELRGIVGGIVSVRTLAEQQHSGMFGGPVPDALMVLIKLLASLVDDNGDCAVAGIPGSHWPGAEVAEDTFRDIAGVVPGTPLIGSGSIASRLYAKPSATVIGLDAPGVNTAANAIVPAARARISVRIPAGVDWEQATQELRRHIVAHTPWGVTVDFEPDPGANGTRIGTGGNAYAVYAEAMTAAYGRQAVRQGAGGSIPFVANLAEAFPDLQIIATGAQDPRARIHAPQESIDLAELQRAATAQVLFLASFGASA